MNETSSDCSITRQPLIAVAIRRTLTWFPIVFCIIIVSFTIAIVVIGRQGVSYYIRQSSMFLTACIGPSELHEGNDWSHERLISHYNRKNLVYSYSDVAHDDTDYSCQHLFFINSQNVEVRRYNSRDITLLHKQHYFGRCFSWGRFLFISDSKDLLFNLEQALK